MLIGAAESTAPVDRRVRWPVEWSRNQGLIPTVGPCTVPDAAPTSTAGRAFTRAVAAVPHPMPPPWPPRSPDDQSLKLSVRAEQSLNRSGVTGAVGPVGVEAGGQFDRVGEGGEVAAV